MASPKKKDTTTTNKSVNYEDWSGGDGVLPFRDSAGPLFLMTATPCFSIVFYHIFAVLQGDLAAFVNAVSQAGLCRTLQNIWPDPWKSSVWAFILGFMAFQILLMKCVPGKRFEGTMTPKGNVPVYTANGMACYVLTLTAVLFIHVVAPMGLRLAWLYDNYGEFLASMNVFAWAFCTMLLVKGHLAPSSTDSGHTGSYVKDFYWGYELYPRLPGNIDVKMFTNCRFGMMMWAVATLCFAAKSAEMHGGQLPWGMAVNVGLQICYIFKFFHWEMGYMCSMDIQHDRAGYYICWGCLVWVPSVYTCHSFALAGVGTNIPHMSATTAVILFVVGWFMIYINYESDQQRYVFRQNKGNCLLYGKKPHYITAQYKTEKGDTRTNLLLVDGWWKYSRHFHYVPEILAALCWSLPAQTTVWPAYFYVVFLTILLTDRAFRDDDRCRMKYGKYWEEYCSEVPYRIVPGLV